MRSQPRAHPRGQRLSRRSPARLPRVNRFAFVTLAAVSVAIVAESSNASSILLQVGLQKYFVILSEAAAAAESKDLRLLFLRVRNESPGTRNLEYQDEFAMPPTLHAERIHPNGCKFSRSGFAKPRVQSFFQLVMVCQKPELSSAIAFAHKVFESRNLLQMRRDLTNNRDAELVCNKLLEHRPGNPRLQAEEVTVKPLYGNHDKSCSMF